MSDGPGSPDAVIGPVPPGRDRVPYDRMRRRVLWALPTGLYVLGSAAQGRRNLMTISWVCQVATEPKLVAVGVDVSAVTHELVNEGGAFALSLLGRSDRALVRRFVKPVVEVSVDATSGEGTMAGEQVVSAPSGLPVLAASVAWIDCSVRHHLVLGSHSLFVGEVVDCGVGAPGRPAQGEGSLAELLRMEDTRMSYGG